MRKPQNGELFQGRYEIIRELGRGGMGTVYHAYQVDAERDVALKFFLGDKLDDDDTVKRFFREFKLLSKLSHRNIMITYGLGLTEDQQPFAICEYIRGKTLRQLSNEVASQIDWQRAINIVVQVCEAMQFAHNENIIHRDLKPENIMLLEGTADSVKVIDFGLSKLAVSELSQSQKLTASGQLLGSPYYMSPETSTGKVDARSDIYSLGCILFELLSGEKLFDADTGVGIMYRHANDSVANRLEALKFSTPDALKSVISKSVSKTPQERFQSMAEMARALQAAISAPQTIANVQRNDNAMLVVGAIIALLLIAAGNYMLQMYKSPTPENAAAEPSVNPRKLVQAIKEKKEDDSRPWKLLRTYVLASSDLFANKSNGLSHGQTFVLAANFIERLMQRYLSNTALRICDKAEDYVKIHGIGHRMGSDNPQSDYLNIEFLKAEIYLDRGQLAEAAEILQKALALRIPDSSYLWAKGCDLIVRSKDSSLLKLLLKKADRIQYGTNASAACRRNFQIELAEQFLEKAKSCEVAQEAGVDKFIVEQANVMICKNDVLQARKKLQDLCIQLKKNHVFLRTDNLPVQLSRTLAFAGLYKDSLNSFSQRFEHNAILSNATRELLLKPDASETDLLNSLGQGKNAQERCQFMVNETKNDSDSELDSQACYAYAIYERNKSKIDWVTQTRCELNYALALSRNGMINQAKTIYKRSFELIKSKQALGQTFGNVQMLTKSKLDYASLLQISNEPATSKELLTEVIDDFYNDKGAKYIAKMLFRNNQAASANELILKCKGIEPILQIELLARDAGNRSTVEQCIVKQNEILSNQKKDILPYWRINADITNALCYVDMNEPTTAKPIILRLYAQALQPQNLDQTQLDKIAFLLSIIGENEKSNAISTLADAAAEAKTQDPS